MSDGDKLSDQTVKSSTISDWTVVSSYLVGESVDHRGHAVITWHHGTQREATHLIPDDGAMHLAADLTEGLAERLSRDQLDRFFEMLKQSFGRGVAKRRGHIIRPSRAL